MNRYSVSLITAVLGAAILVGGCTAPAALQALNRPGAEDKMPDGRPAWLLCRKPTLEPAVVISPAMLNRSIKAARAHPSPLHSPGRFCLVPFSGTAVPDSRHGSARWRREGRRTGHPPNKCPVIRLGALSRRRKEVEFLMPGPWDSSDHTLPRTISGRFPPAGPAMRWPHLNAGWPLDPVHVPTPLAGRRSRVSHESKIGHVQLLCLNSKG